MSCVSGQVGTFFHIGPLIYRKIFGTRYTSKNGGEGRRKRRERRRKEREEKEKIEEEKKEE
jgi:hypothetical protein